MSDVGGGGDLLVGRESVLAALRSALDQAAAGSGILVLISGEPGIGKSAVLDRLTHEAGDVGFHVYLPGSPYVLRQRHLHLAATQGDWLFSIFALTPAHGQSVVEIQVGDETAAFTDMRSWIEYDC